MLVTRREDGPPVIVHAIPVDRQAGDFRSRDIAVLLLIVDPKKRPRIEPALVGPALGLTPTEAEVAAMLAEGHAVGDIAGRTGRGKNTVRWHIMNIFNKVGVSRQVELVRLVWQWPRACARDVDLETGAPGAGRESGGKAPRGASGVQVAARTPAETPNDGIQPR